MDISMLEVDGVEALKILINNDPAAKVIMISAMGQKRQAWKRSRLEPNPIS